MIIKTDNAYLNTLLSAVCLRMPNDGEWSTATATAKQLDGLASILVAKYAGLWSVQADEGRPRIDYDEACAALDDKPAQAFILAPGAIGADSDDLIYFVENVYQLPVTNENWQRTLQLFRLWYAATVPDEYHEPQWNNAAASGPYLRARYVTKETNAAAQRRLRQRTTAVVQAAGWKNINELEKAYRDGLVEVPKKTEAHHATD